MLNAADANERWLVAQNNNGASPGNGLGWSGLSVQNGNVHFYAGTASAYHDVTATAPVPLGTPVLLTVVADAGDYRFYVNSTRVASSSDPAAPFFGGGQELDAFSYNNPYNPNFTPDCYVQQIGVAARAWSDAEVGQVANDPFTFFAPATAGPAKATGYSVQLKSYAIAGQSYPLIVHPIPYGASFPPGATVTVTPPAAVPPPLRRCRCPRAGPKWAIPRLRQAPSL